MLCFVLNFCFFQNKINPYHNTIMFNIGNNNKYIIQTETRDILIISKAKS